MQFLLGVFAVALFLSLRFAKRRADHRRLLILSDAAAQLSREDPVLKEKLGRCLAGMALEQVMAADPEVRQRVAKLLGRGP